MTRTHEKLFISDAFRIFDKDERLLKLDGLGLIRVPAEDAYEFHVRRGPLILRIRFSGDELDKAREQGEEGVKALLDWKIRTAP